MPRDPVMSTRWRYRTAVLTGSWRSTVERAAADAIAQAQAVRDETQPHGLRWRVPGQIEGDADGTHPRPTKS